MARYPSFDSLPKFAVYVCSDDMGPGSMSEKTDRLLDRVPPNKSIVYIVDENGFRSFFAF